MKKHTITVSFTFTGTFQVEAPTREEAEAAIDKGAGLNLGEVHSNDGTIVDWKFDPKPEKFIHNEDPLESYT